MSSIVGALAIAPTATMAADSSEPPTAAIQIDPLDWPNWRGPEQNGISRETGLVDSWDKDGENLLWAKKELATRSSPIIMRGKLYTLCRSEPYSKREGEKVVCADAVTGDILWENKFNVFLSDVPDTRVGWSCVVGDPATGRVYALGVCGLFQCIDGETGKTVWSHSLSEEFGLLSTYGGRTNVPVIFEDMVLISAVITNWGDLARPGHRFMAFDKHDGSLVWLNGSPIPPDDTTYSTPATCVLGGKATLVYGSGDGRVWALQPRTGVPMWNYHLSLRGINVTRLIDGDTIFMGQSEENRDDNSMGAMAAINGVAGTGDITATGELWRNKQIMVGKSSPVLVDGKIYAFDDSNICFIVDPKTGEESKTRLVGAITRASPVFADGKIYISTTSCWHVLEPTRTGVRVAHRLRLDLAAGEEAHGSVAISHGRIYFPTTDAIYCIGVPDHKVAATERPTPPKEDPIGADTTPAHVQVVPGESVIEPGDTIEFSVRLFNARGQLLEEKPAQFTVDANGQIDAAGKYVCDSSASHSASIVSAKVGELVGTARVRIVPPLPWKFDFENGEVPITWIGARNRHITRKLDDGNTVLVKVTTIPKGTRSQSWMGLPKYHDYTVQADVMGDIRNGKMPDIGLIAQRYTSDLMGQSQQVQIRSWTSVLERFSVEAPFAWKPKVWYTTKFQAATEDGKAVLRAKVWEKGQPEPAEWTVVGEDIEPNLVGSPGLFGNANDAEIFIDNLTVTPNG